MKSYKQIKDDLDGLRLLVEKSELWVFKSKSENSGGGGTEGKKEKDAATKPALAAGTRILLLMQIFDFSRRFFF